MNEEVLKEYILSQEIDVHKITKILSEIVSKGDSDALDLVIQTDIWKDVCHSIKGFLLDEASDLGHINIVKTLLSNDVKSTQPEEIWRDYTALGLAIQNQYYAIVDLLVKSGASVNNVGQYTSALSLAAIYGDIHLFIYFWPLTRPDLIEDATIDLIQGIKNRVCEEEADPSIVELTSAIFSHNIAKIDELLSLDLNVNNFDDIGSTPLFSSISPSRLEIVEKLLKAGADPNIGDYDNIETPLMRSISRPLNPSYFNCSGEINSIFDILINSGADPNFQSKDGITALMCAARFGNLAAVRRLLECGANASLVDNDSKNALDCAKEGSQEDTYPESDVYEEIISLLQEK